MTNTGRTDQLKEELSTLRLLLGLFAAAGASIVGGLVQAAPLSAPWIVAAWWGLIITALGIGATGWRIRQCLRQLGGL